MNDAVVVKNLSKQFRRYHPDRPWTVQEAVLAGLRRLRPVEHFWGLRDVSFTVAAGRVVGVIGANGSGKSTLLRLVGGVGRPDQGSVKVNGKIGALLELGAGFHGDLTGRENVLVAGVVAGLSGREVAARFDAIVAFAELEKFIDHPLRTYSTGMQMRLGFAVAVHVDPEILLIDEVLSVGDLAFQRKCLDRIAQFKAQGCSILLVSHEASLVRDLCDEALWLSAGRLMLQGPAGSVVDKYVAQVEGDGQTEESKGQHLTGPHAVSSPADESRVHPALETTSKPGGKTELVLNENRFGSLELEITAVRFLDSRRRAFAFLHSGSTLRVEIDFLAPQRILAPIFQVHIWREDGLVCCDLNTEGTELKATAVQGAGRVALRFEHLDLKGGHYYVDVGCYARGWAYAYDYHSSVYPLLIHGEGAETHRHAPHSWEIGPGVRSIVPELQTTLGAPSDE